MTKVEVANSIFKNQVRAMGKVAEYEGAVDMSRVDVTHANYGWRSRYNPNHTKETMGFHVSPIMEEVAKEEGWLFLYDLGPKGKRVNIRIVFPKNAFFFYERKAA